LTDLALNGVSIGEGGSEAIRVMDGHGAGAHEWGELVAAQGTRPMSVSFHPAEE